MKHHILCLLTVALLISGSAKATEPFVTFTPQPGCLPLHNAVLRYSANDDEGVLIALRNLQEDFGRVFGEASPNPIPAEAPTRSLIPAEAPTRSLIPAEAPTRSLSKGGEN